MPSGSPGAGHFCILFASLQVPARLGWEKDLARLTPFNRKFVWVAGCTTVLTIIAFGTLTFFLHHEFLVRDRAAVALAAFIAIFWTWRILVDFLYFEHADWPAGRQFVIGHFLLTALFIALASTYWAVVIWSFLK